MERIPETFGVTNLRNADYYRSLVPEDVWGRIKLYEMSFDRVGTVVDWTPVRNVLKECEKAYRESRAENVWHPLTYFDSGSILKILDLVTPKHSTVVLKEVSREIYIYCLQIRSIQEILERFPETDEETLLAFVTALDARGLMCLSGKRVLSLACAARTSWAAERITAHHEGR